jgi:hypothetical protein
VGSHRLYWAQYSVTRNLSRQKPPGKKSGTAGGTSKSEPAWAPSPPDLINPLWRKNRREAQLQSVGKLDAFYDFKFTNRIEDSGIRFRHKIVADAGKDFKLVHYDHGNGIAIADVDGDGLYDIYFVSQVGGNELWRNRGGGRFENITHTASVGVSDRVCVRASFADIDNDGDLDVVTNEFNSEPMVLISSLADKKQIHYLKIKLISTKSNRSGLGASAKVRVGSQTYSQVLEGKSGYLSQSLYPLYFGLGDSKSIDQIEVLWRYNQKVCK